MFIGTKGSLLLTPPLVPALSHIYSPHLPIIISLWPNYILFSLLQLNLPSTLFPPHLHTKTLQAILFHQYFPSALLISSPFTWSPEHHNNNNNLKMKMPPVCCYLLPLSPNYLPLFSNTSAYALPFMLHDQVPHPNIWNTTQNYSSTYFNLISLDITLEDKRFSTNFYGTIRANKIGNVHKE